MKVITKDTTPPGTGRLHAIGDPGVRNHVRARHIPGAGNIKRKLRIGSLNVGSMTSRSYELEDLMRRRRIDIMCLQEVGWRNSGNRARFLNTNTKAYKMFYHGEKNGKNGVGIVLAAEFLGSILSIKKISDRLLHLRLVIGKETWNIVSAYVPQTGCDEEEKLAFWADFDALILEIPENEMLEVGADLNGHVGEANTSHESWHGGHGLGTRNPSGEEILTKCRLHDLILLNTMFIKERRHLVTYCSGGHETQIDFHLCRRSMRNRVKDCKVILGESVATSHSTPSSTRGVLLGLEESN